MQFALLSDVNAGDFINRVEVPIFKDGSGSHVAWNETIPNATKHDTFVYAPSGMRTLYWDASTNLLSNWSGDIRDAVEALGK